MGTCVREGADASVLSYEQHVGVAGPGPHPRVFRQRGAWQDRGEVFRQVAVGVVHADALPVDKVTAEIRGADRDRVAGPGTFPSAVVRLLSPERKRGREE